TRSSKSFPMTHQHGAPMVGRRTVPTLTVAAILGAIAIVGCIEHTITGPGGSSGAECAAHLIAQSGNSQLGPVSQALPLPVTVKVTDNGGLAVIGATVTFSVRQGGGSVSTATTVSGATGVASTVWTMGPQMGPQQLIAFLNGTIVLDSTVFTATATGAGGGGGGVTPAQIVLVSGNGQSGNVGAQLGANVVVKVVDASGVPVSGTTITWAVAAGNAGGSVSPISSLTDGSGQASTIWLLGSKIGLQTLTAKSVTVPADTLQLIATANLGSSGAVLISSGNNQTGPTGSLLPSRLLAKVVDQNNNAVVSARVTWTIATGGGSLTQTAGSGITNALGVDSASWTLGFTVGTQTVTAAVSSVGSSTFTATATTVGGTAATIRIISGIGQVGRSQQVLPSPLVVEVRDASGNTLSGITVTFRQDSIKIKAGFTSPTPVTTGSNGQASVTWTLGANNSNTTVPMAVYASTVGLAAIDTFTATARPEYRIRLDSTLFLQLDTTGATIGAPLPDYLAGVRDTLT